MRLALVLALLASLAPALWAEPPEPERAAPASEESPESGESSEGWEFVLGPEPENPEDDPFRAERALFTGEISVSNVTLVARFVAPDGRPVEDLRAEEVEATVDGEPVEVAALDWYAAGDALGAESRDQLASTDEETRALLDDLPALAPTGRRIVIFIQIGSAQVVTLDGSYIRGHQQMLPGLERLLAGLGPSDLVALLSYDSRLKLWHDFTSDHRAVSELLFDTLGFADPGDPHPPATGPTLAPFLPERRLEEVHSPGEALRVLGSALGRIDGVKDVIFVGWTSAGGSSQMIEALQEYDVVVSVLDVTQADIHLLGGPLRSLARNTGGSYASVFKWPRRSANRLIRFLTGYHVVTLDLTGIEARGPLRLEVPSRDLEVLMKPYVF